MQVRKQGGQEATAIAIQRRSGAKAAWPNGGHPRCEVRAYRPWRQRWAAALRIPELKSASRSRAAASPASTVRTPLSPSAPHPLLLALETRLCPAARPCAAMLPLGLERPHMLTQRPLLRLLLCSGCCCGW